MFIPLYNNMDNQNEVYYMFILAVYHNIIYVALCIIAFVKTQFCSCIDLVEAQLRSRPWTMTSSNQICHHLTTAQDGAAPLRHTYTPLYFVE